MSVFHVIGLPAVGAFLGDDQLCVEFAEGTAGDARGVKKFPGRRACGTLCDVEWHGHRRPAHLGGVPYPGS